MKHIILNVAHLLLHITFFIPVFNLLHIFLDEKVEIGKKLRATVALEEKLRQKKRFNLIGNGIFGFGNLQDVACIQILCIILRLSNVE